MNEASGPSPVPSEAVSASPPAPLRRLQFMLPVLRDPPYTGGELYSLHVARALSRAWSMDALTYEDLGMDNRAPAAAFADAALSALRMRRFIGPVLQDTILYRPGATLNRRLRAAGIGPIVSFGQAVYPQRARSRLGKFARMLYYRRYLATCDAHIVVSRHMAELYRRLRIRRPIEVIYPGFDLRSRTSAYRREARAQGAIRIITAGTFIPSKGQRVLVDGIAKMLEDRPDLRGRFVAELYGNPAADPAYHRSLVAAIARKRIGDTVGLHAHVPQKELWRHFAASDVFVFVASGEGFPLVVGEAMLLGCVPVVAAGGANDEMIATGVSGIVTQANASALARALVSLIDHPERIARMSAAATQQALEFAASWDETTAAFGDALDRLLAAVAPQPGSPTAG